MDVFLHHIYEYKKGLRRLVLHTAPARDGTMIRKKLESAGIAHIIRSVNESKINVFFGNSWCISVIRSFGTLDLTSLTDEQDFILGTLLGYDTVLQCRRYLKRKDRQSCLRSENHHPRLHMIPLKCGCAN